jgi:hypothetical protein
MLPEKAIPGDMVANDAARVSYPAKALHTHAAVVVNAVASCRVKES